MMATKCSWLRLNLFGLFFSCTNLIPLSVIPYVASIVLLPKSIYIVFKRGKINEISFYSYLFYIDILITTYFYNSNSIFDLNFYRYNGSFLIILLPFLILPVLNGCKINCNGIIRFFFIISLFLNLIAVSWQFYYSYDDITGLFVSTNGFGGFMMIIFIISYFYCINRGRILDGFFCVLAFSLLLASSSRGSIISAIVAIICYNFISSRIKIFNVVITIIILLQIYILSSSYQIYLINFDSINSYINNYAENIKHGNLLLRIYENWPRGLYHFFSSPIVGTGFGSINDQNGITGNGLFEISTSELPEFNSAHAHHQFINILGEQGIIGFTLFFLLLRSIYKYLLFNYDKSFISSVLITSFYSLVIVCFSENRFSSPSNVFPFISIFIIFYINVLNAKKN